MVSPFAVLLVFAVTGSAYCRSVPLSPINPQATDINVQFSVPPLVRLVRQTGPGDYNPYETYPDTGKNPDNYLQEQQQQEQQQQEQQRKTQQLNRSLAIGMATVFSGRRH